MKNEQIVSDSRLSEKMENLQIYRYIRYISDMRQALTKRRTQMQSRIKIQQAFILKLVTSRQRDKQIGYETYT